MRPGKKCLILHLLVLSRLGESAMYGTIRDVRQLPIGQHSPCRDHGKYGYVPTDLFISCFHCIMHRSLIVTANTRLVAMSNSQTISYSVVRYHSPLEPGGIAWQSR